MSFLEFLPRYAMVFVLLVAENCPRLCSNSSDGVLVVERELSQYLRSFMKYGYPATVKPAEFERTVLLTRMENQHAIVDQDQYNVLFGQYFRFDVSSQVPYFYRSVQKMPGALCAKLVDLQRGTVEEHLSMTPFDSVLIHSGSDDRSVDALMETCAVLKAHSLTNSEVGSRVLRQYREVAVYFKKKWSLHGSGTVMDDVKDL